MIALLLKKRGGQYFILNINTKMMRFMKNIYIKYAAIFAFCVSALLLPEALFAQGAVVAYANPMIQSIMDV